MKEFDWNDFGTSILGGALSGGLMGAGGSFIGNVANGKNALTGQYTDSTINDTVSNGTQGNGYATYGSSNANTSQQNTVDKIENAARADNVTVHFTTDGNKLTATLSNGRVLTLDRNGNITDVFQTPFSNESKYIPKVNSQNVATTANLSVQQDINEATSNSPLTGEALQSVIRTTVRRATSVGVPIDEAGNIAKLSNMARVPVYFDTNLSAEGSCGANGITINPSTTTNERTAQLIAIHEITHIAEGSSAYTRLQSEILNSQLFNEWATSNYGSVNGFKDAISKVYTENGKAFNAEQEMTAKFAEKFLNDQATIDRLAQTDRNLFTRIRNFISDLAVRLKGTAQERELLRIRNMYDKALRSANSNAQGMQYSVNPSFSSEYDAWDKKSTGGYFNIGTTSQALQSIGVDPAQIYWDKSKIAVIIRSHPEMTDAVIKQVPNILENPVIVMQSQTRANRIVAFGEAYDSAGNPVLCALVLRPNGSIDNFVKIASAYGKEGTQKLLDTSDILYVDPNKNRTNSWLQTLRLQLPAGVTNYGSIGTVTYYAPNVNNDTNISKSSMQKAFDKALAKKEADNSQYSFNTESEVEKYGGNGYNLNGWGLSAKMGHDLDSRVAQILNGDYTYSNRAASGDYTFQLGDGKHAENTLVFMDSSLSNIKQVIDINLDYETLVEEIRDDIIKEARHGNGTRAFDYYVSEKIATEHTRPDNIQSGSGRRRDTSYNAQKAYHFDTDEQNGSGNIGETESVINQATTVNDGGFSMPEKYSLDTKPLNPETDNAKEEVQIKPSKAKKEFINTVVDEFGIETGKRASARTNLSALADELFSNGSVSSDTVENLFNTLYDAGTLTVKGNEELVDYIKGTRFYVPSEVRRDIAAKYDQFSNFAKKMTGNIYFSENTNDTRIDQFYEYLGKSYGNELFPATSSRAEMLERIVDVYNDSKNKTISLQKSANINADNFGVEIEDSINRYSEILNSAMGKFADKSNFEVELKTEAQSKLNNAINMKLIKHTARKKPAYSTL